MFLPGKFGSRFGSTNDEMSANAIKQKPTAARPILWSVDRPPRTREIVESIRCRNLSELGSGRRDVGLGLPQIQQLVDRGGDHSAGRRAEVPDPGIRPV